MRRKWLQVNQIFHLVDTRTKMTETYVVTGAEFVRKVRKVGRRKGVKVEFIAERGRGSHGTLYFGPQRTTVKHRQAELSPGLLHAMLAQLGLTLEDLQQG